MQPVSLFFLILVSSAAYGDVLNCAPNVSWVTIKTCDNSHGTELMPCSDQTRKGIVPNEVYRPQFFIFCRLKKDQYAPKKKILKTFNYVRNFLTSYHPWGREKQSINFWNSFRQGLAITLGSIIWLVGTSGHDPSSTQL